MNGRRRFILPIAAAAFVWLVPTGRVLAHEWGPHDADELWTAWAFEPGIVIPLAISALLYVDGIWRTWRAAGVGHGIRTWEAASFVAGWLALVVALVSPLHPWGRVLFSAHMAQHEILMLVAAPLLVLGKPAIVFLRALPANWAPALARAANAGWWQRLWAVLSSALVAWFVHAIVLWAWHAPFLMDAVIRNEWVHAAQHVSFLVSALLFWYAVVHGRQRALGYGMAVLYMFTTALHSGLLGVLMTFATTLWYAPYAQTTQSWGLSPVEDQQLGGLIMWIPAGVVYIIAGLALLAGWMRESEARVLRRRPLVAPPSAARAALLCLVLATGSLVGCDRPDVEYARTATGGNEQRGRAKIAALGCASCHTIPGIYGAEARVGPPLDHIASRSYIGPGLTNTPSNMIIWIQHPRGVHPGAAMPDLHLSEADARDVACYLYTLR